MTTAKARPVLGYPSKTAAVLALKAEGKGYEEIARLIGSTVKSAQNLYSLARRSAAAGAEPHAEPSRPGIWTPGKIDKARRLFGKTMIYIAEALQVPADELLHYALDGKVPPMGKAGRIGDLRNKVEADTSVAGVAADHASAAPLLLPAPAAAPSREDDEAELAALAAEGGDALDDDAAEEAPPQWRLLGPTGQWLHRDMNRVTYRIADARRGSAADMERVFKINPKFETYEAKRA